MSNESTEGEDPSKKSVDEEFQEASSIGIGDDDISDDMFEEGDDSTVDNTSSTSITSESNSTDIDDSDDKTPLHNERKQVPMMLTEEERTKVETLFQELKLDATSQGVEIEKHRDFWSASVEVLAENDDELRKKLGL